MTEKNLGFDLDTEAFDRLATARRRDMFLAGGCIGAGFAVLVGMQAWTALCGVLVAVTLWIAVRGWPWE